jgi:hypothetical protein
MTAKPASRPYNDEPANIPEMLRDFAADYRRAAEWARMEAKDDDVHPNDARAFEDEAAQRELAATYIDEAANKLSMALGGRKYLLSTPPPNPHRGRAGR